MKSYIALALASTALALPQTSGSSGCASSAPGTFQIQTVNKPSSKRGLVERQLAGALTLTLENGILKDQAGRQGYIASNDQFQFDGPVQAGALQTEGFALCGNNSLALTTGQRPFGATTFWQCLSGDFYNLYADSQGMQCVPIYIQAVNKGSGSASQISDGQPQATTPAASATNAVSQISDGQPQATTPAASAVVSQISDGQPQAGTPAPSATAVVSQISDGQPQAGTPAPSATNVVSQISDGQPQAGTPAPSVSNVVSQISDGQPQAGTPAPSVSNVVSQISDGQPQAGTPAPSVSNVVSQISDGQPQAPVATGNTTISRPNATTSQPAAFTGAAASATFAAGAVAAGLFGLFAML
ncbi:uncharacterized protein EKO05_0006616 [Ascochyta rabiei]|uniref:Structural constituent of cell wall n=1 Tax=Didymella rabiei TaxID=5454 RepID=A0A162W6Y7_DIDRA|nr:uncharacterized protein EKO05_0006616 [Ascochyta rabiei]KZM18839.1 structural constituent of cell wall [Ascochyta rabiei]UPX16202.1 hypothetical protein EKO05_0006616 [Ascochyta rabiei]